MNSPPDSTAIVSSVDHALSVAGLTSYLRDLLESDPNLRSVWVIGEVSSANFHRSGLFFTLSESDGSATVDCVVWNSQRDRLALSPQKGEQAIVLGNIRLYPKRGEYQLTVVQVLPGGEGLQALRLRQLRSRLEAEGLFDPERKRSLPPHPQIVAVVTSPQAAAWGDIQRTLSHRYPGLRVLLSPAIVQGERAPASIAEAIARANRDGRAEVLILARGGGATEDLSCFDDERVVRAIAQSSIPVITGIGHQRDESLADWVADAVAHTPTAAAERAVPDREQLAVAHQHRLRSLRAAFDRQLDLESERCRHLQQRLLRTLERRLEREENRLQLFGQKLAALDPQSRLNRGYAVVHRADGSVVRTAEDVELGQELTVKLARGRLKVKIVEIEES